MHIFSLIGKGIATALISIAALFAGAAAPAADHALVGSPIPQVPAFVPDSLATGIGKTDVSITLVTGTDSQGRALAGYYGFVLDEGTASQEIVGCTAAGTALTSCVRGLDTVNGTTSVASNEQQHRRGASVKITNAPFDLVVSNILQGKDGLPTRIHYDSATGHCVAGDASTTICDKNYSDNIANQGAATSSESTGGIVILATKAQQSGSTDLGSNSPLVLQAKYATSSCQIAQASALIASSTTGKLNPPCLDQNYPYGFGSTVGFATTTAGTSTINSLSIASTTFSVNGKLAPAPLFGGTGVDGALAISSGTTTLNVNALGVFEKDYTSISITGTGSLNFTGTTTNSIKTGTTIVLRSQGACTLTSSSRTMIDLRWLGGGPGTGKNASEISSSLAGGGGGGSGSGPGTQGGSFNSTGNSTAVGGAEGSAVASLATTSRQVLPGGNGGNGGGANAPSGLGSGGLYLECAGGYTFTTGAINATGDAGLNGTSGTNGGGGGGGGGNIEVLAKTIVSDTGSYTVTGGPAGTAGGSNSQAGGVGADGTHLEAANTTFY